MAVGAFVLHEALQRRLRAIENAWGDLGERLKVTQPRKLESRESFIKCLKDAVSWMNRCRKERLWYLSTNQKERAEECLKQTPPGTHFVVMS